MPTLLPVQEEGVEIIQRSFSTSPHKGFILADKMGIGKTAQAIELVKRAEGVRLIICPAYLLLNWMDELQMWGVSLDEVCVIDSGKQILRKAPIYLVAYSRVINPALFKQLLKMSFSLIVCDEGHALKTWNSGRSNKILGTFKNRQSNLLFRSKNILLLTGTPVLNRIEELYNLVIRIAPGVLDHMSRMQFYQFYAGHIEFSPWGVRVSGIKNEADLRKRLSPILLRRTKIEGLPDKSEEVIRLNPNTPELKKLFALEDEFLKAHGITADNVDALTKLSKVDVTQISETRRKVALCKIPAFLEMLDDMREDVDGPIVVYTYHREVLAALNTAITEKYQNIVLSSIDGGTDLKKRHEIVKAFQAGDVDVLTATIGALREGISLTRGACVVFLELDYTPANIGQAIGRLHRRGQTNTVRVIKMVFMSGIEKRIMQILNTKQKMIDKILKD